MTFRNYIGMAGIASDERRRAIVWGKRFERGILVIALWILIRWVLDRHNLLPLRLGHISNWMLWIFFVAETSVITTLVRDKRRYLLSNWINWVIIMIGFPLIKIHTPYIVMFRVVRVLLVLRVVVPFWDTTVRILAQNRLGSTLLVSLVITLLAGALISTLDPGIKTIGDGFWFAWETVTTVGYGDVVPHTAIGRVFSSVLILLGIVLISLLTANISAYIIGRGVKEAKEDEEATIKEVLKRIQYQISQIEIRLKNMEKTNQSERVE